MKRKDMRGTRGASQSNFIYKKVVSNGNSRGLNLAKLLKDWKQVRITVLEDGNDSITLMIENAEVFRL